VRELDFTGGVGMLATKKLENYYRVECIRDGKVAWVEEIANLVVDDGLNDSLDKHLKGNSYTAAWYVGLAGADPVFAAGDLMGSHAGWDEAENYSGSRPSLILSNVVDKSCDNISNRAQFTLMLLANW
jgi:hypothetical protein